MLTLEQEIFVKRIGKFALVAILVAFPVYVLFLQDMVQGMFSGEQQPAQRPVIVQERPQQETAQAEQSVQQPPPVQEQRREPVVRRPEPEPARVQPRTETATTQQRTTQQPARRQERAQTTEQARTTATAIPTILGDRALLFSSTMVTEEHLREYRIRNMGNADLQVKSVRISGADGESFALKSPSVFTVKPGEFTTVLIAFTPATSGAKRATLNIEHNDPREGAFVIELVGSAISNDRAENLR